MKIEESILSFYQHLLLNDEENKMNWMLHKNGMCNSVSRNPDECLSLWIVVKKNFVEIVALIEAKDNDTNKLCSDNFEKYLNENNINGLYRLDNTVDEVKFRSKRRSRWVKSHDWLETPIECFDWALNEYYKYVNLLKNL